MYFATSKHKKVEFKTKLTEIQSKVSLQEDVTIINVYIPTNSIKIHEFQTDKTKERNRYS